MHLKCLSSSFTIYGSLIGFYMAIFMKFDRESDLSVGVYFLALLYYTYLHTLPLIPKRGSVYWKYMSPLYLLRAHRVNEQASLRILLSNAEWLETGLCLTLRGSQTLCRSVHILAWYLWHLPDRDEDILETLLSFTSAVIQCHTWSPRGTSFQDPKTDLEQGDRSLSLFPVWSHWVCLPLSCFSLLIWLFYFACWGWMD